MQSLGTFSSAEVIFRNLKMFEKQLCIDVNAVMTGWAEHTIKLTFAKVKVPLGYSKIISSKLLCNVKVFKEF